jgi:hypothetical protein
VDNEFNRSRDFIVERWNKAIRDEYKRTNSFYDLMPPPPPLPWYRRKLNMAKYRIWRARERVGEWIAGRKFDE